MVGKERGEEDAGPPPQRSTGTWRCSLTNNMSPSKVLSGIIWARRGKVIGQGERTVTQLKTSKKALWKK